VPSDNPPDRHLQRALALVEDLRGAVRDLRARFEAADAAEPAETGDEPESPISASDLRRAMADAQESAFAARRRPGVRKLYGKTPAEAED